MALRKRKPTSPGRRFQTVSDFSEITKTTPGEVAARPQARHRWPQQLRPQDRPPQGRRPQAAVPHHRLQAHQGRRARQGRRDRVRPEPQLPHRAAPLPTTARSATSSPPTAWASATCCRAARAPRSGPATRCRCATSPSAPPCTTSSSSPARGGKMARSRRHRACSSWPRRATSPPCACRAPRCAACPIDCRATVGEVGNAEAELIKIGKAGRNRWKGVRPQTRGVAMNPVDHPLGGGEGKTSGGRHPVSPWGKPEGRTRDKTKPSQKLIVRRRRTRGSRR